jgi:hypothetical protein
MHLGWWRRLSGISLNDANNCQRCAQFGFDRRAHRVNVIAALVVQLLQLIDIASGSRSRAQRENLSEFEKGQPQFLEGFPDLLRRRPVALAAQSAQERRASTRRICISRGAAASGAFPADRYSHVFLPPQINGISALTIIC